MPKVKPVSEESIGLSNQPTFATPDVADLICYSAMYILVRYRRVSHVQSHKSSACKALLPNMLCTIAQRWYILWSWSWSWIWS